MTALKWKCNRLRPFSGRSPTVLPFGDMLHVSTLDGVSPITHTKEAIGLALAAEQHLADWFGRAGRPSRYLSTEQDLKPETSGKIVAGWSQVKAGSAVILDGGMKYYPLATSNMLLSASAVDRGSPYTLLLTGYAPDTGIKTDTSIIAYIASSPRVHL